ncbi:MAG TPA: acetoacetate decarboxylase family protein [Gemmatimonadaceae bacterium]
MIVPDFPWHQQLDGNAVVTFHVADAGMARHFVPRPFEIVTPWPGRTVAALYWARYGAGSDVPFGELTVSCALVRHRGRRVQWLSHSYVDESRSRDRSRMRLGMPRELADFPRDPRRPRHLLASRDGQLLCRVRLGPVVWGWRRTLQRIAMHQDADSPTDVWVHGNEIAGRVGVATARIDVPRESPLHVLGLGQPLGAVCVRDAFGVFAGADFLPRHTIPVRQTVETFTARRGAA